MDKDIASLYNRWRMTCYKEKTHLRNQLLMHAEFWPDGKIRMATRIEGSMMPMTLLRLIHML